MKASIRIASAMLIALIVLPMALAEGAPDFSSYTLDELYVMREQLNAAISQLEESSLNTVYESGYYVVGTDLPAGDYVLYEKPDALFASAVVYAAGETKEMLGYHLVTGQVAIRLETGTQLALSQATARPLNRVETLDVSGTIPEGSYPVGSLLPAGAYTAVPSDKAPLSSYSIYGGILGTDARLLKMEVLRGAINIDLMDGDYIELSGCTLITRN